MVNKLRRSPLQVPANSAEFLRTFVFDRAPTTKDFRNFKISDLWIQRNPEGSPAYGYFVLVDKPKQSGIWIDLGGVQTGDIQSVTGDDAFPVLPDAVGNINVLGGTNATTSGSGNTLTIDVTVPPTLTWIVDTTTPINALADEAHIANGAGQIIYNLPALCVVGDRFAFLDLGGNGFEIQFYGLKAAHVYFSYDRYLYFQRLNVTRYGSRVLADNDLSENMEVTRKYEISSDSMGLLYRNDADKFINEKIDTYPEFENPNKVVLQQTGWKMEKIGHTIGR